MSFLIRFRKENPEKSAKAKKPGEEEDIENDGKIIEEETIRKGKVLVWI